MTSIAVSTAIAVNNPVSTNVAWVLVLALPATYLIKLLFSPATHAGEQLCLFHGVLREFSVVS